MRILIAMRRKPGTLIPIERSLLAAAVAFRVAGQDEFHGYAIARSMQGEDGRRPLTGYGTLYRALERLENAGLLQSRWEDPELAFEEDRPRRRLYSITALGQQAAAQAEAPEVAGCPCPKRVGAIMTAAPILRRPPTSPAARASGLAAARCRSL